MDEAALDLEQAIGSLGAEWAAYRDRTGANADLAPGVRREAYLQHLRTGLRQLATGARAIMARSRNAPAPANLARMAALWISVTPMTSARLADGPFTAADLASGQQWQQLVAQYCALLTAAAWPGLDANLRAQYTPWILSALRRAFLTLAAGPAGAVEPVAISDPAAVAAYRRAIGVLQDWAPGSLELITDLPPPYDLPTPVPEVNVNRELDLSDVPDAEWPSVRYSIAQFVRADRVGPAVWPVTMPVRGAGVDRVRYELVFDDRGKVLVNRLGPGVPRPLPGGFANLGLDQKKAQLRQRLGLSGIEDGTASWTAAELDQVRAAYDRIPDVDRPRLRNAALVRDAHNPVDQAHGAGRTHIGRSDADDRGMIASPPPHIHCYDLLFGRGALRASGAPGDCGPGGDWSLLHEFGHLSLQALRTAGDRQAEASRVECEQAEDAFRAVVPSADVVERMRPLNERHTRYNEALAALGRFRQAVDGLYAAMSANPEAGFVAARAPYDAALGDATHSVAALRAATARLATAGFTAQQVEAAEAAEASLARRIAGIQALLTGALKLVRFVRLAHQFGFTAFTAYGRTSAGEWFAETYALYATDPNRMWQLSWQMHRWLEAGMPLESTWQPRRDP